MKTTTWNKTVIFGVFAMALATASLFSACGGNRNASAEASGTTELRADAPLDVDALLASADSLSEKEVNIEGVCTHICKHGGKKIFLMGSDDTRTIRVEAGSLGAFDAKCVNSIVRVKGILKEQRVDEAYLRAWEERLKAQADEKHGEGEEGCATEKKARQETASTPANRIADFRAKIAVRAEKEGKDYLSFYFVEAQSYEIQK